MKPGRFVQFSVQRETLFKRMFFVALDDNGLLWALVFGTYEWKLLGGQEIGQPPGEGK